MQWRVSEVNITSNQKPMSSKNQSCYLRLKIHIKRQTPNVTSPLQLYFSLFFRWTDAFSWFCDITSSAILFITSRAAGGVAENHGWRNEGNDGVLRGEGERDCFQIEVYCIIRYCVRGSHENPSGIVFRSICK